MNVTVEVFGHQHFRSVTGEVLMWGSTVEKFNSGRDALMVPCVIIKSMGRVQVIPLKTESTWAEVHILEQAAQGEMG